MRGLTTAANLWVVAAIGLACGAGYYSLALLGTAIAIIALWPLRVAADYTIDRWRREGRVRMPRLALSTKLDLRRALESIGLGLLFEPGPDLAGLFAGPASDTALGRVLQNARLEVDEEGTRAAAATAATAVLTSAPVDPPFELVADRPFTWAIDDASGTLLFVGVVDDPTEEESD